MDTPQRYPLFWPSGWPRARGRQSASFGVMREQSGQNYKSRKALNATEATRRLEAELERLGAKEPLLSTNQELTLSGMPKSGSEPGDPGAAVFFKYKGKDVALACDKWDRLADNIAALAKHIEAMRGMDRWGVGTVEQLFTGYIALPAPEQWWNVLGCLRTAPRDVVERARRRAASLAHPDQGGSDAAMARVNAAWEQAQRDLDQQPKRIS